MNGRWSANAARASLRNGGPRLPGGSEVSGSGKVRAALAPLPSGEPGPSVLGSRGSEQHADSVGIIASGRDIQEGIAVKVFDHHCRRLIPNRK